jgi:hypothetical protein
MTQGTQMIQINAGEAARDRAPQLESGVGGEPSPNITLGAVAP